MKINKIKINAFGKIKNKEINLENKINLIQGKNEAGKSTLIKFILNSFYGISKNKKGKEYSDFEKYTPWLGEEFSGKIEYELDNKEKYEIFRDFKKKNPQIFNDKMEDISKQFNIDKTKGNEFFYEQTKIDENLFTSTILVNQQEVKLENKEQTMLIQKIANLVGTGEDNVSYKRAIDRINRRQLEEIGTERFREKPINLISKKIEELRQEKEFLEKYKEMQYKLEEEKNEKKEKINKLENENEILKEIKLIKENKKIEEEKIKLKENIIKENNEKINSIKNEKNKIENNNQEINIEKNNEKIEKQKNKINKLIIIILLILILINIAAIIAIKNNFKYIFLLTVPAVLIFWYFLIKNKNKIIKNNKKIEKNQKNELDLKINNLKNEIKIIEKNNSEINNQLKEIKNKNNLKNNLEKEKIKNKYLNKIEKEKINNFLEMENLENINYALQKIQNQINNKKIELHTLEIDTQNIQPKLENLSKIEEELVNNKRKMSTLQNLNMSMNIAKEILSTSYEKMKNTVTPKFTQELSKNISEITNGKYNKVMFNDEQGLLVETKNGNYVQMSKLSIGTIDQLYLSLRLSMLEDLSEEKMPIILDEAFAYYDDERLENILKYLNEKSNNHQIIIFTCTKREEKILENKNINYNKIIL
ncbi:MAG: AAA family ATPase [Clostridia bacterium]